MPTTSITELTTEELVEVLEGTYMEGNEKPYAPEEAYPEFRYRLETNGGIRPNHIPSH